MTIETLDRQFLAGSDRYRYGFLDEDALRRHSLDPSNRLGGAFLDKALRKGDSCFAILDGETLASFCWYSDKPAQINEDLELHFHPAWIYMYHGHTRDEYRGQRLFSIGMAKAAEALIQRGFNGVICYVEANNSSSMRALHRVGFRHIGSARVLRVFGRHIIRRDATCREYGLDVKEAARECSSSVLVEGSGALGEPPAARRRWFVNREPRGERSQERRTRRLESR